MVPKKAGNRFVWKVEARLYRSNFKHKKRLPVEMIRARLSAAGRTGFIIMPPLTVPRMILLLFRAGKTSLLGLTMHRARSSGSLEIRPKSGTNSPL